MKISFEDNAIPYIKWPLYFPNFNPIEYYWRYIKKWVYKYYPEFIKQIEDVEEIKKCMVEVLQDAWAHINNEFLMSLFELM
jgi:hypothetical protein